MRMFETIFFVTVLLGTVLLGAGYLERRLLYYPDSERVLPAAVGLVGVEELAITTSDRKRLVAWYGKARPGQPTILYFHGNAGSLINRAERMARLGLMRVIHPTVLGASRLMSVVREEMDRENVRSSRMYQVDLDGLQRIRTMMGGFLGMGAAADAPRYAQGVAS